MCVSQLGLRNENMTSPLLLSGFSTCGLERSAKEQLGSEDAQRTCWRAVSGSFQQVLEVEGGLSNGSRVLHPRQSEERHGLLQSDVVVFANVIVIVFFVFFADGKRFYCIWLKPLT